MSKKEKYIVIEDIINRALYRVLAKREAKEERRNAQCKAIRRTIRPFGASA